MIKHIQKWNEWRKHNGNNPMHKFMVLIGLIKSPTFALFVTQKEAMVERIKKTKKGGLAYKDGIKSTPSKRG